MKLFSKWAGYITRTDRYPIDREVIETTFQNYAGKKKKFWPFTKWHGTGNDNVPTYLNNVHYLGTPRVMFMLATPAKWNVFRVIWVPGSPARAANYTKHIRQVTIQTTVIVVCRVYPVQRENRDHQATEQYCEAKVPLGNFSFQGSRPILPSRMKSISYRYICT
jgi:hypothetical protein